MPQRVAPRRRPAQVRNKQTNKQTKQTKQKQLNNAIRASVLRLCSSSRATLVSGSSIRISQMRSLPRLALIGGLLIGGTVGPMACLGFWASNTRRLCSSSRTTLVSGSSILIGQKRSLPRLALVLGLLIGGTVGPMACLGFGVPLQRLRSLALLIESLFV